MADTSHPPPAPKKKSNAGPPPYTITCEQPAVHQHGGTHQQVPPPTYTESMHNDIGWRVPQPQNVVVQQPSSVLYVTRTNQPTVIVNQGGLITGSLMTCPTCRALVNTKVTYRPGCQTHMYACLFCLFGCWICSPLPYCTPSCQDEIHYCANCGHHVATVA